MSGSCDSQARTLLDSTCDFEQRRAEERHRKEGAKAQREKAEGKPVPVRTVRPWLPDWDKDWGAMPRGPQNHCHHGGTGASLTRENRGRAAWGSVTPAVDEAQGAEA